MKMEIQRAYKRRVDRQKRQQEKIDLEPVKALQPKSRSIRYDNMKSAMAEESVIAQILREPEDLSGSTQAMADYIRIIDTEQAKQREDIDPLLAAREKYLEKKSYGG
jgi:DNA primase